MTVRLGDECAHDLWKEEGIMKRAFLLMAATSLCLIALDLRAEEQPLAMRIDHFYVVSDKAQALFDLFKETFQLPEAWPFSDRGTHTSGGLWFGNVAMEFLFPPRGDNPVKTEFRGIAFEPAGGADATAAELTKRGISHAEVENRMRQGPDGQARLAWSVLRLENLAPTEVDVFFVDYKNRMSAAARYHTLDGELMARKRGPLGIVGLAEITIGVRDLDEARDKWGALLSPSPQISDDAFVFDSGSRIRLVRAELPGIQGIVLKVRSLDQAAKFLEGRRMLAQDDAGHIAISPAAIDGLLIRLIDDSQAGESADPLLGLGRDVDHVGVGVRDLEKARRDYEQILGFKSTEDLPSISGLLRSIKFFEDGTLLEFLSPPQESAAIRDETRRWVEKHEGAVSLALATSSARRAAGFLEAHNFEVMIMEWPGPTKEGEVKLSPVQYYSVSSPDTPSGDKRIFGLWIWLVDYVSSPERAAKRASWREQGLMDHPNTALGIPSVRFAGRDLEASLQNLQDMGLEPGEAREAKFLGASGREVKAGEGALLLLRSADANGALTRFLSDHMDGDIIGLGIEVADLNKARSWIENHSGRKLEPDEDGYGRSAMIPLDLTHGVWLELFQR
jgi:catechol 2,3-dioxygenase-like lactoylglutathione lyase family enzyme